MELNDYLAGMAGLLFIYVIIWYLTVNSWFPQLLLSPISAVLGLCALVLTAIFVVSWIREM